MEVGRLLTGEKTSSGERGMYGDSPFALLSGATCLLLTTGESLFCVMPLSWQSISYTCSSSSSNCSLTCSARASK